MKIDCKGKVVHYLSDQDRVFKDRDMELKGDCKGSSGSERIEIASLKVILSNLEFNGNSGFRVIVIGS